MILPDGSVFADAADKNTYTVIGRVGASGITGFKLWAMPDERLPAKGPGRASDGSFVVTGFRAFLQAPGKPDIPIELRRPTANYSQKGFGPESVLKSDGSGKGGWGIKGKAGEQHWIAFRTAGPFDVPANGQLRFVIEQNLGGGHVIGRFRIAAITGDGRGLQIERKDIADGLEMYPEKRLAGLRQNIFKYFVTEIARDTKAISLQRAIDELTARHQAKLMEVRAIGSPMLPRRTHILHRGEFLSPTAEVKAGTPRILAAFRPRAGAGDRLDLATWLVSNDNCLTPRVAVNHVWKHLFGEGLVRTVNDFGVRGESPSHPELLDWLADRYRSGLGWRRKELIRLIVGSATYRQSSRRRPELAQLDPLNTLLYRQNRFRVEAEIVRDLSLAVGGLLSTKIGGPSVFPPMPPDLAALSYGSGFKWSTSAAEDRYRRGMYTFFKRTIPHPNLTTFDCPDANTACVARPVSNTPLQALTLLNNEAHVAAARGVARRVLRDAGPSDQQRLAFAMRLCIARPPSPVELAALQRLLDEGRKYYTAHPNHAAKVVSELPAATVADGYGGSTATGAGLKASSKDTTAQRVLSPAQVAESASWTAAVRMVLNLDEFITRE